MFQSWFAYSTLSGSKDSYVIENAASGIMLLCIWLQPNNGSFPLSLNQLSFDE